MYEYAEPNEILGIQSYCLLMMNLPLSVAANLNQRSFVHDIENGLLIGSQVFNRCDFVVQ